MNKMVFVENYLNDIKKALNKINIEDIKKISDMLFSAWQNEKKIFIIGNGGSATTASHFASDLSKGTVFGFYGKNEKRFMVQSLTDNIALLTAYGNDLGFEDIFAQQLKNILTQGDVVLAITCSGNSKNIVKAIEYANSMNAMTAGLLGFGGGKVKDMMDVNLVIESNHYGVVEDCHSILTHLISYYLKERKKNEEKSSLS